MQVVHFAQRPRPVLVSVLAVLTALLGLAGVATAAVGFGGDGHPKEWDPRVKELAAFVERERGLEFEHPVRVDFLSAAQFRDVVTGTDELTAEDKRQIEQAEAVLRAVGLVSGDVDLLEIGDELVGDGTVGLYTFDDQRISVRGETLDDEAKSTLVHELTHALQDQHFDLGSRQPESSGAGAALEAVAEADAEAVRMAWVETLPQSRREALAAAEEETSGEADFEGVPSVFVELMGFPYAFGPELFDAVVDEAGLSGRNRLFTDPPVSEEHVVLPRSYLSRQPVEKVAPPGAEHGEKAIADSDDDFGMVSLLVVLAERIDYPVAWDAVQGWAGDATNSFERDGRTCVRINVAFDQTAQAERFEAAFVQWGQGFPTAHSRSDRLVKVESCDPGTSGSTARAEDHVSGIQGLGIRSSVRHSLAQFGMPKAKADCVADHLLENLGVARFLELDEQLASEDPPARAVREVQTATESADRACP